MLTVGKIKEVIPLEIPPELPPEHNNIMPWCKIKAVDADKEVTGAPVPLIEVADADPIIIELSTLWLTLIKILWRGPTKTHNSWASCQQTDTHRVHSSKHSSSGKSRSI